MDSTDPEHCIGLSPYNPLLKFSMRSEHVFFSSRRRHTTSKRNWSSDVCSSDLLWMVVSSLRPNDEIFRNPSLWPLSFNTENFEIGRASCRERGDILAGEDRYKRLQACKSG